MENYLPIAVGYQKLWDNERYLELKAKLSHSFEKERQWLASREPILSLVKDFLAEVHVSCSIHPKRYWEIFQLMTCVMAPSPICSSTSEQLDLLRLWKMRSWLWRLPRPVLYVQFSKDLENLVGRQLWLSDWHFRQSRQLTVHDVFPPNGNSLKINLVDQI